MKKSCTKRGNVHHSAQCGSFFLQPMAELRPSGTFGHAATTAPIVCPETGGRIKIGGPYYMAPMHNKEIVNAILSNVQRRLDASERGSSDVAAEGVSPSTSILTAADTEKLPIPTINRLHGLLTAISEELNDSPFFYLLGDLCSTVRCTTIPLQMFQSALINGGYRVSVTHKEPTAIKTNAPDSVVWDIVRCWCKLYPPTGSSKRNKEANKTLAILAREPTFIADFTIIDAVANRTKALRHPPNPEEGWGPKKRAGRGPSDETEPTAKKFRNPPLTAEDKAQKEAEGRARAAAAKNAK